MTTSLPPQGAFQQSPYIQTHSSNNTPSFPSSTNQTAYFSPRSDNKQFLNQPNQHNPPRNLSPNFVVQPQKVPHSNLRMSNNPQIPFQNGHIPSQSSHYGQYQQHVPYYGQNLNPNAHRNQVQYLPSQNQGNKFSAMNVNPGLIQSQGVYPAYPGYQGYNPYQQGYVQQQIPSTYMQPYIGGNWNLRLPQNSINKKFDYDEANFDVDYKVEQNLINCVICEQVYKISQKSQHLQRHRQKIRNIDIKPVNQSQLKRLQKYNKLVKKGLITKPIVEPEQFNIQYDPNQYILNKIDEYYDPNEPSIKQIQIQTDDPRKFGSYRQKSSQPPIMTINQSFDSPRNSSKQNISNQAILSGLRGRQAISGQFQEQSPSRIPNIYEKNRQTNQQRFDRQTIPREQPTFLVQKMLNNSEQSVQNLNSRGTLNQSLGSEYRSNRQTQKYQDEYNNNRSKVQTYKNPSITNSQMARQERESSSTVNQYTAPQNVVASSYRESQKSQNRDTMNMNNNRQDSRLYDIRQEDQLGASNSNTPLKKESSIKIEEVVRQASQVGRFSDSPSFN